MNYTIIFSIIAFLILNGGQVLAQVPGECNADPLPYHYGANWKNASAIPRLATPFTDYHTQHTDAALQGGNFVSTSTIVDHTGSGKLIKLHRFNPANGAVDELKYRYGGGTIPATAMSSFFGTTGNYITGGLENYTLGWHDNPALIKRFDFNAPPPNVPRNIDLLIRRHINNTAGNAIRYDGTVITKMIESGGDIFAVGYAYVTGGTLNNWTQAFMVRINPTVFNNPNFNCSGFGCTGDIEVRVIPHQNSNWISWFNDLIEFNGRIYACGYFGIGSPSAKIGWGLLSRWDDGECWSFEQNFTGGMPPRVPPPGSGIWPTISFNSMTIEPINNHLLLLYTDPFSYIGGILRMDNTNAIVPLALGGHTAFWLNNAPNPFVAPTAFPPENNEIILSQIEYVSPTSILIGGYMQDVSLPPGSLPTNLKNTHVIKDYFAFVVDHNPSITTNNGPFPFHSSYGYRNDQPLEDFETNLALKKGWDIVVPNGRIFSRDAGNDIYFSSGKRRVSVSPFQQSNFVDRFPLVDLQTYVVNPGGRLNCERRPMCLESADPTEPTMPFVTTSGPGFLQTELGIEVNTESRANIDFGEDFKHFCDQPIDENLVPQSSANPNVCAYFYDLQVDQNGTIYNTSNPLPGNRPDNMRLCQDDCIDLSVTFRHGIGLGENTYQWSRNGTAINGATDCNLQVCEADVPVGSLPVTYRVVCTHTESLGVCTAAYEVVIRAPFDDQILASPSNQLCQGQTATLSVNNTDISSYEWRRWNGATYTVVSNSATYATNVLGHYSVKVIYNNLCEDELEIDLTQRDITLTQAITETNSTNEDLVFTICNHNTSDIMNVELTTSLAPPLILDNNSASAGWINTGGNYTYTIPLLLAATSPTSPTCTPIVMPVRVNKCPATNMAWLSSTDPIYTCGTVTHSQPYWQGNNFTAQITNTNLTSCTGAPITLSGAPATGGFTYQWLRNSTPIPAATAASQTANTSGLYRVEISRNGCMKSDEKQVRISTPMTITHSSTQPVCTRNNGSITVNVTGGTAPYEYSINNGTNYTTSNVFNNLLAANYPIMVRDANGCTSSLNFNLTTRSNTLNYTATITPKICTAKGSIAIINPTTTGTCTAGSFTYLWSNGQTTATVTNLSPGSYTVTVTDCDGCTRVQTYQVGNISNTVNFTANLTHNTCASAGSIAIVNSSTTGSCGAGTYTYLWSNGQTTATATNLTGGTYTVKVTDCNGCTKVNSYTIINYNSLIQAEVVQSLMNCAITPNIVRYTAYPSGGTPGYNYSWLRNGTTPVGTNSPIYETNDQTNLSVIVTDANGYCFKKIIDASVNNPTVRNVGSENGAPNLSLTTIQTANNLRIRIKGNFNLDVNANWNHCDVIFETPTNSSTILTNVNLSSGIIFNAKNTHIHTCDANMQKGMVVQGTGRVDFDNCLVQDMYSAFQIIANADMRLRNNTTLENNFIGIKLLNQTVTSYNLNGGHQFNIRGGTIKTIMPNTRYLTTNLSFSNLEPAGNSMTTYTKSYAGIVSENSGWTLTSSGSSPILMSNLANGILINGGNYAISKVQFKDIRDLTTIYTCAQCRRERAISAESTTSAAKTISYSGLGGTTLDIDNAGKGIMTSNYSLTAQNLKIDNVIDRAIEATCTNASTHYNKSLHITGCSIKATKPVHANYMQTINLQDNSFEDISTAAAILAPMVDISSTINLIPIATIARNSFKINKSRYGLSITNLKASSPSTMSQMSIVDNTFNIFNTGTGTNGTYAAAFFNNLRNVDISNNQFRKYTPAIFSLPSPHTSATLANTAPAGAILTAVENGQLGCNHFYTISGACFLNNTTSQTFNGLDIVANHFTAGYYGMLFQNYANATKLIPTHSNKFTCAFSAFKVAHNITTGTSIGSRFAAQNNTFRLTCPAGICYAPSLLPYSFWDATRTNITVSSTTSTAGNPACAIVCPPKPTEAPPQQSAPPMHKIAAEEETETEEKVNCYIFPNPARDQFSIELQGLKQTADKLHVEMLDMQGRVVYQRSFDTPVSNRVEVNHSATSGTYIVRVSDGQGLVFVQRIAVHHQDSELK